MGKKCCFGLFHTLNAATRNNPNTYVTELWFNYFSLSSQDIGSLKLFELYALHYRCFCICFVTPTWIRLEISSFLNYVSLLSQQKRSYVKIPLLCVYFRLSGMVWSKSFSTSGLIFQQTLLQYFERKQKVLLRSVDLTTFKLALKAS